MIRERRIPSLAARRGQDAMAARIDACGVSLKGRRSVAAARQMCVNARPPAPPCSGDSSEAASWCCDVRAHITTAGKDSSHWMLLLSMASRVHGRRSS